MSTINAPQKLSRRQELREDQLTTFYARSWGFFEENKTLVYGALAAVVVAVAAIIGYGFWQSAQADEAQVEMAASVRAYEAGNLQEALDGTDQNLGLLDIIDRYGGTEAGNLAHFYAADAYFQLGHMDQALEHFSDFDKGDNLLGASAFAGEAAIHEVQGDHDRAGDLYTRAASVYESDVTSAEYLMKAGRSYEAAGSFSDARRAYTRVQDDFSASTAAQNVGVALARLDAMQ